MKESEKLNFVKHLFGIWAVVFLFTGFIAALRVFIQIGIIFLVPYLGIALADWRLRHSDE